MSAPQDIEPETDQYGVKKSFYARCHWCGQHMAPGNGCTKLSYDDFVGKEPLDRVPYGQETRYERGKTLAEMWAAEGLNVETKECHDCNVQVGQLHHPGCDMEECPKCHGQAFACGCPRLR